MNNLKVCFVGIGSIGKRHIRNLYTICYENSISLRIDVLRTSRGKLPSDIHEIISNTYYIKDDLSSDYDIIFITNPTDIHMETLEALHDKGKHFFIEKPITSFRKIANQYDIVYRADSIYYVACPLRYTNVIQYIKENINPSDVISVRAISSSYLPEWRPGTDYRNTYSAHKEMGGGVSTDLIHEWDYLTYLFGEPKCINYMGLKKSNLDINCEDSALYIAEYNDKTIELHLDYFGRKTLREVMLIMNDDTIIADFVTGSIQYLIANKIINLAEKRNEFQKKELIHFLKLIKEQKRINYIEDAYKILGYTQGIVINTHKEKVIKKHY